MIKTERELLLVTNEKINLGALSEEFMRIKGFDPSVKLIDDFMENIRKQNPIKYLEPTEVPPFRYETLHKADVPITLMGVIDYATNEYRIHALCCFEVADKEE